MRILFVAPLGAAFGEALQGVRLATRLAARGHDIVFLASESLAALIEPTPFLYGRIDSSMFRLDRELTGILRRLRCDALVLVDLAAMGKTARACKLDVDAFVNPAVPVVALDCWNLPRTPVAFDYAPLEERIDPRFFAVERKLVPVPFTPPDGAHGFRALPEVAPASSAARQRLRDELGLATEDRIILWPTARWQHATSHDALVLARRAAVLPHLVLPVLAALDPRSHVVHVGPMQIAGAEALGSRYRFLGQVDPQRFEALVAAADVLASFNAAATSLATAVAARTPVVLGTVAEAVASMEELPPSLRESASPILMDMMRWQLPMVPMRSWPLSLHAVLSPTMADNPYYDTMVHASLLDPAALGAAFEGVLFDAARADDVRARQARYAHRVAELPAGEDVLLQLLG